MKKKSCPFEREILNYPQNEKNNARLQAHLVECPLCRETLLVGGWLKRHRDISNREQFIDKNLPDADLLFDKAYSSGVPQLDLVKKATRPMLLPGILAIVVGLLAPLYLVLVNFNVIKSLLSQKPEVQSILIPFYAIIKNLTKSQPLILSLAVGFVFILIFILLTTSPFHPFQSIKFRRIK